MSGTVAYASRIRAVSPGEQVLPTRITGELDGLPPEKHRDLAVAVNGRIRAVGRSFDVRRAKREFFSLMVPEQALRPGRNRVELFEVRPDETLVRLAGA